MFNFKKLYKIIKEKFNKIKKSGKGFKVQRLDY